MENTAMKGSILAITDHVVPVSAILADVEELGVKTNGQAQPAIVNGASSLKQLPAESSSMDVVISIMKADDLPSDELLHEILRVLKPGGAVLCQALLASELTDKPSSALQRKLLLVGFLEAQFLHLKPLVQLEGSKIFMIKASTPSWKIGSSFALKKSTKALPKLQIDDESDLIDEDSLLTEEDLQKPQLPPELVIAKLQAQRKRAKIVHVGGTEIEAKEKVPKLGLTMDQVYNPKSACGSCGLGDAFRCSTCPYRGLAPFKMGEKVSIPGNFLAADI